MKKKKVASRILRIALRSIIAVVLLVIVIVAMLYTPFVQNFIRDKIVERVNEQPGVHLEIGKLRLHFPLDLEVADACMTVDADTVLRVGELRADVKLMPLLDSKVDVTEASLADAYYRLGAPDSAMCMRISAGQAKISPATVDLATMDIDIVQGELKHARVDMTLLPDTMPADTAASQAMKIRIGRLDVEDLTYTMSMMPTIDSLGTGIGRGYLADGLIDLEAQKIDLKVFCGESVDVAYISPSAEAADAFNRKYPPVPASDTDSVSPPWTIQIDTLAFTGSRALYTTRGVAPEPGLDFAYIALDSLDVDVRQFYNQGAILRVPLRIKGIERCGLPLAADGTLMINDTEMILRGFSVDAPSTHVDLDALMGLGDLTTDPDLPLRLKADGYAGLSDIATMFPGYKYYLSLLPKGGKADVAVDVSGSPRRLAVDDISLTLNSVADLKARGVLDHVFDPDRMSGDLALSGNIYNVKPVVDAFVDPSTGLTVPPMKLDGNISYSPGATTGDLVATTGGGRIALDAAYRNAGDVYDVSLRADNFPVDAFMGDLGIGRATLDLTAKGNGFDLFSPTTAMHATANVGSLDYDGYEYTNIHLIADIADGNAEISGNVDTDDIQADISGRGNLDGDVYRWDFDIDKGFFDLHALKFSEEPAIVTTSISGNAAISKDMRDISARLNVADLLYSTGDTDIQLSGVEAKFAANDTLTSLDLHNRDLAGSVRLPMHYSLIADGFSKAVDLAMAQIDDRHIDIDTIQRVLPRFDLNLVCGPDNMITDILAASDMSLDHLSVEAYNDSSIFMCTKVLGFNTGTTRLDSIDVDLVQQHEKMHIVGSVNNRPGTLDNWAHITADGMVNGDKVSLRLTQQNINNETGFDIGAITSVADSTLTARIFPLTPVIGYKKWTVNLDNFLKYNFFTHRVDANLKMKGDKSSLQLTSVQSPESLNDMLLSISDINLEDWLSFNPFAPPIQGSLSADMRLKWDGGNDINGDGTLSLSNFFYDNRRVASIDIGVDVETNLSGMVHAKADVNIDGEHTMSFSGNLNDSISASPFNMDFTLIKFPLSVANPFLPIDVAQLTGVLNGNMLISGDADNPKFNGEIYFTDAAIKTAITNTRYRLSDVKIPVKDNVVTFTDFNILGANENPLYANGTVDLRSMSLPKFDLNLKADNMMIVNTSKAAKNASIYGKGYINLDADVKGNLRFVSVDADVTLLAGSNVTYVLAFDDTALTGTDNEGLVKFVNLADTTNVAAADSISANTMLMNIEARATLQNGTTINVDLPTGTRDKVVIQPQGTLTYTQTPMSATGRLTGRVNLNSGMARYTMPVIGAEKTFTLNGGSYVAFNGDALNPVINLEAVDAVKCNVSQEGQGSRPVNFDIMLGVTGTLDHMDVKFDLSTNDDITVANELQTMSAEQRASQAMNMLLYNVYTGPGNGSGISLSANPLFSFLESQINNWAAQNIHGVDLTFGIDQYNQSSNGSTSTAMSYSYQVSKTLFNDRFKIVVGGNYTTDDNADENIAENLINDISFEYYLNTQQTMLVKVFRHMGFESILEGEITQTGVGFVYRRKIEHMIQVLPKFMRPKSKNI